MPKKKKKREKGGDGMTLAQRIEAMKKEKEASLRQATTVEEEPAAEEVTKTEEPSVEIIEDANQQSQEEPENQKPDNQGEIPDLRQELIPPEFENCTNSFFIHPKDKLSQMNFEFGYLPPAMFLPEQSYVSRRAYQMFGKYHDYIDNIDKLLDHTLRTIIINNSNSPEDRSHTTVQDMPPNEDQVRALIRYLLTDNMQMEMDRFLADV